MASNADNFLVECILATAVVTLMQIKWRLSPWCINYMRLCAVLYTEFCVWVEEKGWGWRSAEKAPSQTPWPISAAWETHERLEGVTVAENGKKKKQSTFGLVQGNRTDRLNGPVELEKRRTVLKVPKMTKKPRQRREKGCCIHKFSNR